MIIRSMSINKTGSDPRTIHVAANLEDAARAALKDVGVAGLVDQLVN